MSTLLSQVAVEAIRSSTDSEHTLSQLSVEVVRGSMYEIKVHQFAIEIARPNVSASATSPHRPQISACP